MGETMVSAKAEALSFCSDEAALEAADRLLGPAQSWGDSVISYRLDSDFQAGWKAEVGRWLLLGERLGFLGSVMERIRKRVLTESQKPRVTGANDSAHLLLGQELAPAMIAYYFIQSGWAFVEWEPRLPQGVPGDVDVRLRDPSGKVTDIQVKAPDQPGERVGGQVQDGEYNERVIRAVEKGFKQLCLVPGPQRMVVVCPQRLWADDEMELFYHLIGNGKGSGDGAFTIAPGNTVGAVVRMSLDRGLEHTLYRCTVFLNPWAAVSARPVAAAFTNARVCYIDGAHLRWKPEAPQFLKHVDGMVWST